MPLTGITLGALLARQFPPRHYLLNPVLRQGESAMVWANTGVGKTLLVLSMALAMAGGGSVLGWAADRPWRVLLCDGEMAIEDLQERLQFLAETVDGYDAEEAGRNLKIIARTDQARGVRFPDIASPEGQAAVIEAARAHRADIVILDNLSTLAEIEDENAASAMNPVLTFLLNLKGERLASILIHHSGKSGATFRGSSKLATTFETVIGLVPAESHSATAGAAFSTEFTKFRGAPHPALEPRDVVLARQDDGPMRWVATEARGDDVKKLERVILAAECASQVEVAAALGWHPSKVSRTMPKLYARGTLTDHRVKRILEGVRKGREEAEMAARADGLEEDF